MKVDKGVCTSNDAYFAGNTTTNELNSIIKFETVFTTLVENKILAIKRECEEHENKKKSRSLKGILLRKTNDVVVTGTIDDENNDGDKPKDVNCDEKKRKNFFSKYYKKQKDIDVEKGKNHDELVNVVVVKNGNNNEGNEQGIRDAFRTRRRTSCSASGEETKLDSQSNELDIVNADANPILSNLSSAKLNADAAECDKQNCDKLIIDSHENAQVTLSTNNYSNVLHSRKQQQQVINYENDESLATTIDISLQQQSSVVVAVSSSNKATTVIVPFNNNTTYNNITSNNNINNKNNNNNNGKSDIAICDDGTSSQNTSDIEFSLNSENSLSELPRSTKNGQQPKSVANSDPIIKKSVNVVSPPSAHPSAKGSGGGEKKVCERKAISCQSTPIFGRHKHVRSESEGKKVLTFQKELPKREVDTIKSQTIVIAPTSTTTTTTLATSTVTAVSGHHQHHLEAVHVVSNASNKKSQKHSTKLRDVSLEYEITYDDGDGNQSPHGFISSFNQLTSQKQSAAIISANIKKQTSKDQHRKTTEMKSEVQEIDTKADIELDELDVEVVNSASSKKKNKRRRQSSRCADPSASNTVYPSTSGIKQQCILSKPPNQPIQIDYDSGFMYDMQVESEFNGEIKSIVPNEHKRHRHKHHHDHERCRKKRRKRKILVHNLDDKSLKVIDPDSDELPQRAKFTIIATACLLLVMCLLLVGVTLRMAPLIDDMVRQENERLLQDSLNRAKMAVNFTEPPLLSTTTTSSPLASHAPSYIP